ncbi:MAG: photosystem II stability/assembly factor-like uncharacterized protein [Planctomycetota bacterium]|jgi:photosystem II stability/assembly factor-like uncharacterized protein
MSFDGPARHTQDSRLSSPFERLATYTKIDFRRLSAYPGPAICESIMELLLSALLLVASASVVQDDSASSESQEEESKSVFSSATLSGMKLRSIGPAMASGRIADVAIHPDHPARWIVATASGGVWRTHNAGTTWESVFDGEGSYSIGCVSLDPSDPNVVWVGSGENNSQRSVSYGDGVYRSRDGGKSWENMGLGESEHIGEILIDPRDSNVILVAAQGPLWSAGGERGVYRSADGGETWTPVLSVDEHTGANEIVRDPRNPDVLYASTWQRRRRQWTLLNGGPGSGIWKSTDAGLTWREIKGGLPGGDMGRIGLAISGADPDIVYAVVEATRGKGGFYRSTNRGESWSKQSDRGTSSPQYYHEIFADPHDRDRVYLVDTFLSVTEDGGKTFSSLGVDDKHVDDHYVGIDPNDSEHLLVGCDGGLYETWDRGETWRFCSNLPITQFYRVSVDEAEPFYNVYGGTQDNNSMGGPSRTIRREGITNGDWLVTVGGDGYETVIDPTDPNIVYSLWQYGGLVRHDRRSGEVVDIKPKEGAGEPALRWNWDSPLILSPHDHKRLYFAANKLYRSDDRGNSWRVVSPELSREIDRDHLKVMGRLWGADAVARHHATSFYGSAVSMRESILQEGHLWVGSDDGLIHTTRDGGEHWTRFDSFPGVPENTYVTHVEPDRFEPNTVYAAFDNHKSGDFKPYLLRSTDRGATWSSMAGDLPERGSIHALVQDHVDPGLFFVGTEFGVWFTSDAGEHWVELSGNFPTIAVRDIEIQRRENDLVLGTFGRSFWILDDYSPLRGMTEETLASPAKLFPIKDADLYIEGSRLGGRKGRGSQGANYFTAKNPPFGATITFSLAEKLETKKEIRQGIEKDAIKADEDPPLPSLDELRAEAEEIAPEIQLEIRDEEGSLLRTLAAPRNKGLHRVTWDLREPATAPLTKGSGGKLAPWDRAPRGPLALPGVYSATLVKNLAGARTQLSSPQSFEVIPLNLATLPAADRAAAAAFQRKVGRLSRAVAGAVDVERSANERIGLCLKAVAVTSGAEPQLTTDIHALQARLRLIRLELTGDSLAADHNLPTTLSVQDRVRSVQSNMLSATSAPTQTEHDAYRIAGEAFGPLLDQLSSLVEGELATIEASLEALGAPHTRGRIPSWTIE